MERIIANLKSQILEAAKSLSPEERERFYDEINEWTYEQYEAALLNQK